MKSPRWNEFEDIDLLQAIEDYTSGMCNPYSLRDVLQERLPHRSLSGMVSRFYRLRYTMSDGGYTVTAVAYLLGAPSYTVRRWIRNGYLRADSSGSPVSGEHDQDRRCIHTSYLCEFIEMYPFLYSIIAMPPSQYREHASKIEQRVSLRQASVILNISIRRMQYLFSKSDIPSWKYGRSTFIRESDIPVLIIQNQDRVAGSRGM